ncbi:MAG: DUF370 domain-containing protein [Oscillospiraceae bacterium]|nr:DUF370 domain-containing protein [Oscillospiraceae bacterium]
MCIFLRAEVSALKLISVGFGNAVNADRIVAVVSPEAAPVKRIVQVAKDGGMAVDATCGRKTRSVIVCDSGHVILSALRPEALAGKTDNE